MEIDPNRASPSKLAKMASAMSGGEIAVLPTDTNYALVCRLGDKEAITRIRQIRNLGDKHTLTLILASFTSLGKYAAVDNIHFRLLKDLIPGPYTFILPATKEVPRIFFQPKRKTVGIRIPLQAQLSAFMVGLACPLVSTSLKGPGHEDAAASLEELLEWVRKVADISVNIGPLTGGETTVLDLAEAEPTVIRHGIGDVSFLEE